MDKKTQESEGFQGGDLDFSCSTTTTNKKNGGGSSDGTKKSLTKPKQVSKRLYLAKCFSK